MRELKQLKKKCLLQAATSLCATDGQHSTNRRFET